jgi:acyl-CoA reductase-like NAD-dependent aldehyde dehydrogenase
VSTEAAHIPREERLLIDAAVGAARVAFDDTRWSTDHALRVRRVRQLQEALRRHADDLRFGYGITFTEPRAA